MCWHVWAGLRSSINSKDSGTLWIMLDAADFPLVLAPMVGLGHVAFREVLAEFGGFSLLVTEMCSARAVATENPATSRVFRWQPQELPRLVCQIFGSDPHDMAQAARRIAAEGFAGVDINMGCAVAAITRRGAGAALLTAPQRAEAMVQAVADAVSIPVSVKFRTVPGPDLEATCRLAQRLEAAGARWLTFHPRVAPDRRTRPARWQDIAPVVAAVRIPVLGNGDVWHPEDARAMMRQTGCAGVSIGRAAAAKPWIFAQIRGEMVPDPEIYLRVAQAMVESVWRWNPPQQALQLFRKWVPYLCANFVYGHEMARRLRRAQERTAIEEALARELDSLPPLATSPNPFLIVG